MTGLTKQLNDAGVNISLVLKAGDLEDELQNMYNQLVEERSKNLAQDTPPTQSILESRIEVAANYLSGFAIAYVSWLALSYGPMTWGWFDIYDSFIITTIFTAISITRSYFWRRFFAVGLHSVVKSCVKGWIAR